MKGRTLTLGCWSCKKVRLAWAHDGERWRGKCSCGFETRASTLEGQRLDEAAGLAAGPGDTFLPIP